MKILLVCNYRPGVGGISGQVEELQKHLRKEGHDVDIFSTKGSAMKRLSLPSKLKSMARGYDVLHVHCCSGWGFLPAYVAVYAGRRAHKRVVLTYHGGGAEGFFAKRTRLVKHVLSQTDCNIVLSGFTEGVFHRHGLPCTVIPNIVDIDAAHFRQRKTIAPRYICTRAHEELYNIPCILRAFRTVQATINDARLTLVGDGSLHADLVRMADDMGLRNVTFTGRVDNSEIFRQLENSDVLLSAPKVDNMPVSLLEAMNAGLLVVSSNVGGVPFMIRNGRDGLLFESDNDAELAQKMLWAVENPTMALAITMQARRTVERYRWESIREAIYKAYGLSA